MSVRSVNSSPSPLLDHSAQSSSSTDSQLEESFIPEFFIQTDDLPTSETLSGATVLNSHDNRLSIAQEVLSVTSNDLEGSFYLRFEQAYESGEALEQLLALEKLADIAFERKEYVKAALVLNSAIAATQLYDLDDSSKLQLSTKLEKLEIAFLKELGIQSPPDQAGYFHQGRHFLKTVRANARLQLDNNVSAVRIQSDLTHNFQILLSNLVSDSIKLMGDQPPTRFAIMGLGSMSRKEMCPYSDIEFAILIEQDSPENKGYFRRLSQILQMQIINLGETSFPVIRPKRVGAVMMESRSLTPKGFSLDNGGLSPLGKTGVYELIGTPAQLAAFLHPSWLEKNEAEVILANALASCCFVSGHQTLLEEFKTKTQEILESEKAEEGSKLRQERARALLEGHLEEFKPLLDEHRFQLRGFDAKKDIYRPIQMVISALALYHGLESTNSLVQIQVLKEKGLISSEGASQLEGALYQALVWRVKAHLFYKQEKEILYHSKDEKDPLNEGLLLFSDAERRALVGIYRVLIPLFNTVQRFLQGNENALTRASFDVPLTSAQDVGKDEEKKHNYQKALAIYSQSATLNPNDPEALNDMQRIKRVLGQSQDALRYNQERLAILKKKHGERWSNACEVADCYANMYLTLSTLSQHEEALACSQQALAIRQKVYGEVHHAVAASYIQCGEALRILGKFNEALKHIQRANEIHSKLNKTYAPKSLGLTLVASGKYEEGLECLLQNLEACKSYFGENHPITATNYAQVGNALLKLKRANEALNCFHKVLAIRIKVMDSRHPNMAVSHNNIGTTLTALGRLEEAMHSLTMALDISQRVNGEMHDMTATCYENIGKNLYKKKKFSEALDYQQKALAIREKILGEIHPQTALSHNNISVTLVNLLRCEEALQHMFQAKAIWEKVGGESHPEMKTVKNNIAFVLRKVGRLEEAAQYDQKVAKSLKKK